VKIPVPPKKCEEERKQYEFHEFHDKVKKPLNPYFNIF